MNDLIIISAIIYIVLSLVFTAIGMSDSKFDQEWPEISTLNSVFVYRILFPSYYVGYFLYRALRYKINR